MAFVLGAVLASTDPVAVSALARRLSLPARVQALVQAESLFNDGTSLVLFQIAVSLAVGGTAAMAATGALLHGVGEFAVLAGGGVLAGAAVAAGVIVVRRRITDPVLETVAALITPYVAYLLGEVLHVSGVTAVIVAGLVIGARRSAITTAQTRLQLHSVYQTLIFVLESVVFSLIGLQLPTLVRELGHTGQWPLAALAVTGTLIATRVAWVFPVFAISGWRRGRRRPSWPVPAVVSWAGTRGVVPLAAALSIPLTTASGAALPQRDLVLVSAAAVIVVSLIVQGFTLEPLARLAGFGQATAADPLHEETVARLRLAEAGELAESSAAPDAVIDRLRTGLQTRIGNTRARLDQGPDTEPGALTERELLGDLIAAENAELSRSSKPARSARLPDGGCSGAWTWRSPGLPKGAGKREARPACPPVGTELTSCAVDRVARERSHNWMICMRPRVRSPRLSTAPSRQGGCGRCLLHRQGPHSA